MSDPTVFLVDDDPAVLKGLVRLLRSDGWNVVPFESAQSFLDAMPDDAMGCVVLDVAMPGIDGMALQQSLALGDSLLGIIFLTGHGDLAMGVHAMKVGAVDFLSKPVEGDALLAAVRVAVERSAVAHRAAAERKDIQRRLATLTPREREVLGLVVMGRLNKQIAAELGTVEKTIKVHRARVMEKMMVRSLAELVRLAARAGIGEPVPERD
jgi:FixJ family two-component response regulator